MIYECERGFKMIYDLFHFSMAAFYILARIICCCKVIQLQNFQYISDEEHLRFVLYQNNNYVCYPYSILNKKAI